MAPEPAKIKIIIVGAAGAGKTALARRFLEDKFEDRFYEVTVEPRYDRKVVSISDESVTLGLWDTAGHERFRAMTNQFYRNAFAAIVCYNITEQASWDMSKAWAIEARERNPNCRLYFCGTKLDLVTENPKLGRVTRDQVRDFGSTFCSGNKDIQICETSSKSGEGINELFLRIASDFIRKKTAGAISSKDGINLDDYKYTPKSGGCC